MKMSRNIQALLYFSLFSCTFFVSATEYEKLTPEDVIKTWNDALYDGDISVVEKYTSKTAADYVKNNWGSLGGLSKVYQQLIHNRPSILVNRQKVSGNMATVEYTTFHPEDVVYSTVAMLPETFCLLTNWL